MGRIGIKRIFFSILRVFPGANKKSDYFMIGFFFLVLVAALLTCSPVCSGEPTYRQGVDIFIETGVDQPDRVPTWYAPWWRSLTLPYLKYLQREEPKGDTILTH